MTARRGLSLVWAAAVMLSLAACSSGIAGDGSAGPSVTGATTPTAGTLSALLTQLPASAAGSAGTFELVYGDLDRATAQAGLTRPTDGQDSDAFFGWLNPITGIPFGETPASHSLPLAQSFSPTMLNKVDEIEQEVGWSILDVHQYAEVQAPPQLFAVATTEDLSADLEAAWGPATDGVWGLDGEDFSIDPTNRTPARPLGQAVRLAQRDGVLAVSRAKTPILDWLAGGATLADDPALADIAAALDEADVSAAMIASGHDFSVLGALGTRLSPEEAASIVKDTVLPLPFDTAAAGLTVTDGDCVATVVLHFGTAEAAEASRDPLIAAVSEGTSPLTGTPVSDRLTLRTAEVKGQLLVVTLDFADARPGSIFQMLMARDIPFVHS